VLRFCGVIRTRGQRAERQQRWRELLAEDDHLSERQRIRVRDRELRRVTADSCEAPSGAAMQPQLRRTAGLTHDFDITPQHTLRVPCSERLHRRFLGREPAREMNRWIAPPHAIRHFGVGEDSAGEPVAVAVEGGSDSRDVRGVESEADDGHAPTA
jgi:hypothetical protein